MKMKIIFKSTLKDEISIRTFYHNEQVNIGFYQCYVYKIN